MRWTPNIVNGASGEHRGSFHASTVTCTYYVHAPSFYHPLLEVEIRFWVSAFICARTSGGPDIQFLWRNATAHSVAMAIPHVWLSFHYYLSRVLDHHTRKPTFSDEGAVNMFKSSDESCDLKRHPPASFKRQTFRFGKQRILRARYDSKPHPQTRAPVD